MKKTILSLLFVSGAFAGTSFGADMYIDVQKLFGESKEGKTILAQNEKDKESIFSLEYQENQKLVSFREKVEGQMREGKLTENDLQEKQLEMQKLQKLAKRAIEDKQEEITNKSQQRMLQYKDKIFAVAQTVLKNEGWDSIRDKNAPGIVCVAENTDKTSVVLKAVNEQYEKERVQSVVVQKKGS